MQLTVKQGIYLAALLHDIGKFWQRASRNRKELKEATLQMVGSICPVNQNEQPTHLHSLFTHEFFENNRTVFPGDFEHEGKKVQLGSLSARHHKHILGPFEQIIKYADILSSGHDRRIEAEEEGEGKAGDIRYKYKKIPLLNPFDRVYEIRQKLEMSYFPLKPLKADKTIFATRGIDLDNDRMEEYSKLWNSFEEEVQSLPKNDFSAQAKTLLSLLRKYTWCIPSATNTMPDISLYDHLKTTAAIAACLYDSEQIEGFGKMPNTTEGLKDEEKERFVLLVGDFSGIQKFIYQLSSKGAAKTLKGRSFYLNILQDAVITKIKSIFEIEDAHTLMASGGRFQILLPNDVNKLEEVKRFIAEVNKELREDFDGAIYLATGTKAFAAKNLLTEQGSNGKTYTDIVQDAYSLVEIDKSRKFADVINDDFFKPGPVAGTGSDQVCHITGMDLQDHQREKIDDGLVVSPRVNDQIQLGKWLRNADYILKIKNPDGKRYNNEITPLRYALERDESVTYRFLNKDEFDNYAYKDLLTKEKLLEVISVNNTEFMTFSETDSHIAHSFMFYGAAWTPGDIPGKENKNGEYRTVEFTDIAKDGVNNLMAVLRLDVDGLSNLFKEGFRVKDGVDQHLASISRFSNMSEKLDLFFSGYINYLVCETYENEIELNPKLTATEFTDKKPNQFILPVYAGGDDVFIICRWDIAPQIAKRIYDDFKQFTNQHDKMSLSGGVSMVHGKYPIHKAALEAEQSEHKAKTLPGIEKPDGKDAFCMFGQAMSWKDFNLAADYVKQIITWQEEMDSKALLGFLRRLYGEYNEQEHYGRWRWRSAYRLKRTGKRYDMEEELANLATWLFTGDFNGNPFERIEILSKDEVSDINRKPELVDLTGFTVRWVQSLTRNKS